jgi:hypothetical protein
VRSPAPTADDYHDRRQRGAAATSRDQPAGAPPTLPPGVYFEKQELSFCQVHAVNHANGHQVLTGSQLLDHCRLLAADNPAWTQAFQPLLGNFSVAAINHWLFHNTTARLVYKPWAQLTGIWQHDSDVLHRLQINGYASCVVQLSEADHTVALRCQTRGVVAI